MIVDDKQRTVKFLLIWSFLMFFVGIYSDLGAQTLVEEDYGDIPISFDSFDVRGGTSIKL